MQKVILTYGAIYGLLSGILGYFTTLGSLGVWVAMGSGFVLLIAMCVLGGLAYRKANEDYAPFGELVKLNLGIIIVGLVISMIIGVAHLMSLSEDQKAQIAERTIEQITSMYEGMGLSEEQIDDLSDEMEAQVEKQFQPSSMILSSLMGLIINFLISLIPAAIIKKD